MKGIRKLALALALIMALTLVPAAMAEDEPIHISVAGYMFGPIDDSQDVITPLVEQMLLEKHGINVDIEVVYVEQANYAEIINTQLAGGTAPDVFLAQSATALQSYYDQGLIKTWDYTKWPGVKVQLYKDPKVRFANEEVGGLRVRKFLPASEPEVFCDECGQEIKASNGMTPKQLAAYTKKKYGKALCPECAKKAKEAQDATKQQ